MSNAMELIDALRKELRANYEADMTALDMLQNRSRITQLEAPFDGNGEASEHADHKRKTLSSHKRKTLSSIADTVLAAADEPATVAQLSKATGLQRSQVFGAIYNSAKEKFERLKINGKMHYQRKGK